MSVLAHASCPLNCHSKWRWQHMTAKQQPKGAGDCLHLSFCRPDLLRPLQSHHACECCKDAHMSCVQLQQVHQMWSRRQVHSTRSPGGTALSCWTLLSGTTGRQVGCLSSYACTIRGCALLNDPLAEFGVCFQLSCGAVCKQTLSGTRVTMVYHGTGTM